MAKKFLFHRKAVFLFLTGIMCAVQMPLKGDNLYVYQTNGEKMSISLTDLLKLTFTDTEMVIHLNNGTSNPIAYDAMRLFSLKDYTFTSIPPVWQNGNQVLVYQNSENQLVIKSERPVSALNVYDLRGRKMLQLYPGATEFTVSQASLPVGLYIFQIADEQGITVTKFNKIK